jgi:hypothetical protein
MATDITVFSRQYKKLSPVDGDIKVIHTFVRNVTCAITDTLVPIPWEDVRLVKIIASITEVVDAVTWELDFELDKAGGTEMMTMDITKSSAVGAVFEGTVATQAACENLSAKNLTRDAINIENTGTGKAGAANIYFIFEPEQG